MTAMILVKNRRAKFDYSIQKTWHAGIVLTGPEVKSLRNKQASLAGSYVKIINNEAWLINAQINAYPYASQDDYDPKKTRKLLLTKKEIYKLQDYTQAKNYTIIPLAFELINNKIKLKIGIGKGKKEYEKREKIKQRELKRRMSQKFKQKNIKL
jgi:SsrA-binding protein